MEIVVAIAIGVLSLVFVGSCIALVVLCHRRYCLRDVGMDRDTRPILKYLKDQKLEMPNGDVVAAEYELEDMYRLGPNIERILLSHDWSTVAPADWMSHAHNHCVAILKDCRILTDKLSGLSFRALIKDQEFLEELGLSCRRISPRLNNLVQVMYPPLDLRLLEANAAALVLSLHNLALLFRHAQKGEYEWMKQFLTRMDHHLLALSASEYLGDKLPSTSGLFASAVHGAVEDCRSAAHNSGTDVRLSMTSDVRLSTTSPDSNIAGARTVTSTVATVHSNSNDTADSTSSLPLLTGNGSLLSRQRHVSSELECNAISASCLPKSNSGATAKAASETQPLMALQQNPSRHLEPC